MFIHITPTCVSDLFTALFRIVININCLDHFGCGNHITLTLAYFGYCCDFVSTLTYTKKDRAAVTPRM